VFYYYERTYSGVRIVLVSLVSAVWISYLSLHDLRFPQQCSWGVMQCCVSGRLELLDPWTWRQCISSKCLELLTQHHSIMSQQTGIFFWPYLYTGMIHKVQCFCCSFQWLDGKVLFKEEVAFYSPTDLLALYWNLWLRNGNVIQNGSEDEKGGSLFTHVNKLLCHSD
jgi:hypothetical protein